jgi:peptide/nickel transport system substrate-binding protein
MDEYTIRELIEDAKAARLPRRQFMETMVGLGLTLPMAAQLLATGKVHAQPSASLFSPRRRGGGGQIKLLYWQAPTLLNPHLATGTKDFAGARVFYEPLADFDSDGNLVPVLAAEAPTVENGAAAKDGTWVIWRLKKSVSWHDGRPVTSDDVISPESSPPIRPRRRRPPAASGISSGSRRSTSTR